MNDHFKMIRNYCGQVKDAHEKDESQTQRIKELENDMEKLLKKFRSVDLASCFGPVEFPPRHSGDVMPTVAEEPAEGADEKSIINVKQARSDYKERDADVCATTKTGDESPKENNAAPAQLVPSLNIPPSLAQESEPEDKSVENP